MKTTPKVKSDTDRACLRESAARIIRYEQRFSTFAAQAGMTQEQLRRKIAEVLNDLTGAEIGGLDMLLEIGKRRRILCISCGYSDAEIDRAIDAARKRMGKAQAGMSA